MYVMGRDKWFWFIPYDQNGGAPNGDGVVINKISSNYVQNSNINDSNNNGDFINDNQIDKYDNMSNNY